MCRASVLNIQILCSLNPQRKGTPFLGQLRNPELDWVVRLARHLKLGTTARLPLRIIAMGPVYFLMH
jgi:hypothetical protein